MPNSRQRVYFDANVIIAYLADEAGRASVAAALLEDAQRGNIELLTSVLSVTEVAFIASDHAPDVSNADESAIEALWSPGSPIRLTDISIRVAERARSIIRAARSRGMRSVKPADAIHLASAKCTDVTGSLPMNARRPEPNGVNSSRLRSLSHSQTARNSTSVSGPVAGGVTFVIFVLAGVRQSVGSRSWS